jgi:hypothetical protein
MSKQNNINFHKSFKPESQYISSILEIADGSSWRSLDEISEITGIPNGEKSGKVEPHIYYSEYMNLIVCEKKKKQYRLNLTEIGKTVLMEDPGLQEILTKNLLHAMIIRVEEGALIWSTTFHDILPRYREGIEKERLILELNNILQGKVTTKNLRPFIASYEELFSDIGLLSIDKNLIKCNSLCYSSEHIYMYALVLWKYWGEFYPEQDEISSVQLAELGFGKAFGWDVKREYEVMEHLADRGLVRMNRQLMPYTILKLTTEDELIDNLYSELC